MCGITGMVHFDGSCAARESLWRMTSSLAHRGPDAEGLHVLGAAGLGHRRLSIIDIENGRQPLLNEDGQVAVTFNGEIYNFRELREQLVGLGHSFRTRSDTEVIVHAWEQWGKNCVERFRGMFAFAVADWRRRVIFLARDHLGIKPLYYFVNERRAAFASELQALRVLSDFPSDLDLRALDQYLFLGYIPAPRTVFKGVSKLPPASRMLVYLDGRTEGPEQYWHLEYRPERGKSAEQWAEELESVIRESVKAHLVADVPFGAFLSGGMDSSLIVGMMAEEMTQPVKAFTIAFDEEEFSELAYARQVAERWGVEHHVEVVRPDALAVLPSLVRHYGEPFGDSSAVPTHYVSRLARRFVVMVLSGDGGDEAFAGYNRYQGWLRWLYPKAPQRSWWKRLLRPVASAAFPRRFRPDPGPGPQIPTAAAWQPFVQCIARELRRNLWRPEHLAHFDLPVEAFDVLDRRVRDVPPESFGQYADYQTYLPNDILVKVDVASMMHGLEVRTPLVDVRVAEFAARIPAEVSLARAADGRLLSKSLLRRILSRQLPESFVDRPKMGFLAPIRRWFQRGGGFREELTRLLTRPDARIQEYFDPRAIESLLARHDMNGDVAGPLWQLLFLEVWLDDLQNSRRSCQFREN